MDLLIFALIIAGTVIGFRMGFIRQLGSMAGIILGIIVCNIFGRWASNVYMSLVPESHAWATPDSTTITFALMVLFLVVYFSVGLASTLLQEILFKLKLGIADKLIGIPVGMFQFIFALSILLNGWLLISPSSSIFTTEHAMRNEPFKLALDAVPFSLGADAMPSDTLKIKPVSGSQKH